MCTPADLDVIDRRIKALSRQMTRFDHWHDTMHSPWYKRVVWWVQGYRLLSLGTWYRASWNESARKYD